MMDGYALIAINEDGSKSLCFEHKVFDIRLEDLEFCYIEDGLTPSELKDCLVIVFFKYSSVPCGGYEYEEYEDCFTPVSHTVIQEGYKEFWQQQITIYATYNGLKDFQCRYVHLDVHETDSLNEVVGEWEEFYNEDFEPFKTKAVELEGFKL